MLRTTFQMPKPRSKHTSPSTHMLVEYKPTDDYTVELEGKAPEKFSREKFNIQFGVSLTYGICYKSINYFLVTALRNKLFAEHPANSATRAVKAYLNNPKNYFSVRYINSTCGYGLIASQDIPTGTVVGIYSGELIIKREKSVDPASLDERAYDMSIDDIKLNGITYSVTLRAKHYSDITRFAIHAPSVDELDDLSLGDIPKEAILTAKMHYPLAFVEGAPIRYYQTSAPIKKNELVPIDYGKKYWKNRGAPHLFVQCAEGTKIAKYSSETKCYKLTDEMLQKAAETKEVKSSLLPEGVFPTIPTKKSPVAEHAKVPSKKSSLPISDSIALSQLGLLKDKRKRDDSPPLPTPFSRPCSYYRIN